MLPLGLRECILRKNCCSLNFVQIKMNVWTTGPHSFKMILFLQAGADRRGERWRLQSENTRRRGGTGGGEGGNWVHPWKRSVSFDYNIVLHKFDQILLIVMMLKRKRMGGISILTESCSPRFLHFHFHFIRLLPRPQSQKSTFSQNHLIGSPAPVFLVGTTTSYMIISYWQGCSALLRWQILIIRLSSFPPILSQLLED